MYVVVDLCQFVSLNDAYRSILDRNELKSIHWSAGAVSILSSLLPMLMKSLGIMENFFSHLPSIYSHRAIARYYVINVSA